MDIDGLLLSHRGGGGGGGSVCKFAPVDILERLHASIA